MLTRSRQRASRHAHRGDRRYALAPRVIVARSRTRAARYPLRLLRGHAGFNTGQQGGRATDTIFVRGQTDHTVLIAACAWVFHVRLTSLQDYPSDDRAREIGARSALEHVRVDATARHTDRHPGQQGGADEA